MNERARVLALLLVCGSAACGESGGGAPPDTAGPDTTTPKIVSTSPMGNVPILSKVSATFDEPLDPATVTSANVRLTTRLDDAFPAVAGTVTYDVDTSSILFTPLRPLTYDATYQLHIGAVADTSGNVFGGAALPFHAVVNAMTREVIYTNSEISSYNEYSLDTNGHVSKFGNYASPGGNGMWFDSDDPPSNRFEYDYAPDGLLLAYRQYGVGTDGKPDSPDDPVVLRDEYIYDSEQRLIKFAQHASAQVLRAEYNWTGRKLMTSFLYNDAGTDLLWNTPDDRGPNWREYTQDATGANIRMTTRNNGGDAAPLTSDDFIQSSTTYDIDPTTLVLTKQITYGGPGLDMMWLSPDDAVANYIVYTINAQGLVTTRIGYSSKGTDGDWFTPDDVRSGRLETTYNASGLETNRDSLNGSGAFVSYTTTTYDAAGNRTSQRVYLAPGTDGDWHTSDDVLAAERKFDVTH